MNLRTKAGYHATRIVFDVRSSALALFLAKTALLRTKVLNLLQGRLPDTYAIAHHPKRDRIQTITISIQICHNFINAIATL